MSWPLSQDYNEAIQSPDSSFSDPELRRGEAVANALGIPMPCSGNFADVYQVRCPDGSRWAVKCFTRQAPGLRERYAEISRHLQQARLPFTIDFSYLEQGIRVCGQWYPIVKMQWVEGLTLNEFVRRHLDRPAVLEALLQIWVWMARRLRRAQVGHGDLQHGNILLAPDGRTGSLGVKLIDYDGMWVPALASQPSGEVGHPAYQHPERLREGTYSLEVDRFPLLLIAAALRCLQVGGAALWEKYNDGDNLLFREADLRSPLESMLFGELHQIDDPQSRTLIGCVIQSLWGSLESTPLLDRVLPRLRPEAMPFPPAPTPGAASAASPPAPTPGAASPPPDWLDDIR